MNQTNINKPDLCTVWKIVGSWGEREVMWSSKHLFLNGIAWEKSRFLIQRKWHKNIKFMLKYIQLSLTFNYDLKTCNQK